MIGRLAGTVIEKQAPYLLVDIQGVGYELRAPMTTFYHLPDIGGAVVLHTHFSVSETSQQLFGFMHVRDRELFRLLIKVSGVGPKMAVGIMSMESDDFVRCIMDGNVTALVKVPGVGKKTAERLIVEMRDKLKDWSLTKTGPGGDIIKVELAATYPNSMIADAESALLALGYKPSEATKAVSAVLTDDIARSEDLIRLALRSMLPA